MYAEAEDYKQIKLHMHILENKGSRQSAFILCSMLKTKRSFLPIKDFLEGSSALKKFEKWFVEHQKISQTRGEVQLVLWVLIF
jgi:ribonuclease PH